MYLDPKSALWSRLDAVVRDEGLVLYDLEAFGRGGLRVVIQSAAPRNGAAREETIEDSSVESSSAQGGVTSGDCSRICKRLMTIFRAEGEAMGFSSEPEIEVSSPGVCRQLRLAEHFAQANGARVKVSGLVVGENGAEKTEPKLETTIGTLEECRAQEIVVRAEQSGQIRVYPMSGIKKANVEFQF